mmetsp:Transcript_131008/g.339289  ORF Transcript_131008/g.339289 Transcript_131008/m.339289 type:complete len:263 (-) Transcript_131008:828-1616(-)
MRPMTALLGLVQSSKVPRFTTSDWTSGAADRIALAAPSSRWFSLMNCSTSLLDSPPTAPTPAAGKDPAPATLSGYLTCSFASRMRPITAELGLRHSDSDPRLITAVWTCWGSARIARAAPSSNLLSTMNCSTSWGVAKRPSRIGWGIEAVNARPPPPAIGAAPAPGRPYFASNFASRIRPITAELGLTHSASEPRSMTTRWMCAGSALRFCAAVTSKRLFAMKFSTSAEEAALPPPPSATGSPAGWPLAVEAAKPAAGAMPP